MKYRFNVTVFLDKEVEIEADNIDQAFDLMEKNLYDVDMADAAERIDDREYTFIVE